MRHAMTWFLDLDGTLVVNHNAGISHQIEAPLELLPNVREALDHLHQLGHSIVITTARPRSTRRRLEHELVEAGIFYDELVMGLPKGPRIVVNDVKHPSDITALAICVQRNSGLSVDLIKELLRNV